MSMFGNIMNKIFGQGSAEAAEAPASSKAPSASPAPQKPASNDQGASPTATAQVTSPKPAQPATSMPPATGGSSEAAPARTVDVGAVLDKMAASHKGGGGHYQTSIVDLLKLLDMDSSLAARKELADELNVHAGPDGSAEENIALHKAVMQKLAENGGVVPESLRN